MVKISRKENESTGSLLRRFSRAVKLSSVLSRARGKRFYESPQSEFQKKKNALQKIEWQKQMQRQRKMGKV